MDELKLNVMKRVILFIVILALLIFIPSWTFLYWQGWIYLLVISISLLSMTLYFLNHDRALMERRIKIGPQAEKKKIQKVIQSFYIILLITLVLISVIDHRFVLSNVPNVLNIISNLLVLIGIYIIYSVFKENSFASATIEVDKEQKVISTGPYSIVRHPMYSGALLLFIFTPIALGSIFGLIPAVLLITILMFRTLDEEKSLNKELSGYLDYCKNIKFRLIPYIW